jgi:hypothetical protein
MPRNLRKVTELGAFAGPSSTTDHYEGATRALRTFFTPTTMAYEEKTMSKTEEARAAGSLGTEGTNEFT